MEKVLGSKRKREIKKTYFSSFPKEERMPFGLMLVMSCLWNTQFLAFYDEKALCGMAYIAAIGKQTFLMFLAVDKQLRSKGYGGKILNEIQALYPKNKIIVSIEPCDGSMEEQEDRSRRKDFYIRNGYRETGYFMKRAGQMGYLISGGSFCFLWRTASVL